MSPFIPGTLFQFAWDSVSLGWFKDCPRKYQLSMGLTDEIVMSDENAAGVGWHTKAESVHLRWGQLYHSAIELYYKLTMPHEGVSMTHNDGVRNIAHFLLSQTWDYPEGDEVGHAWQPDHPTKTRENLIRTVIWYLDQFHDDPAETVQLANGRPAVELSFRLPLGDQAYRGSQVLLCGHLDRIVALNGGVYVMDHKTTATTLSTTYFDQYDLDGQMSGYTLAGQLVFHSPVKGVIINAAQVAVGFSRFARGLTYRTSSQLEEWITDTQHWIGLAYEYSEKGYWPMNDRSCNKYGGCPFRGVCNKDPSVRHRFLESNYVRNTWNPLQSR